MTSTPIGFTSMALDVWYRKIASQNQGFVHLYFPLSRLQSLGTQRDVDFLNVFFWNVHQRRAARPKPDLAQVDADWGQALGGAWGRMLNSSTRFLVRYAARANVFRMSA